MSGDITDPAVLAGFSVISFGLGIVLAAFRNQAISWLHDHARRGLGDFLAVFILGLAYLSIAVYLALRGYRVAITVLVAATLGLVFVPSYRLFVPKSKRSRGKSAPKGDAVANTSYLRLLCGALLIIIIGLGMLLLMLVDFGVNPLIAISSVVVVGTVAIAAITVVGAIDLRQRDKLSEAGYRAMVTAGLRSLSRLLPTEIFPTRTSRR